MPKLLTPNASPGPRHRARRAGVAPAGLEVGRDAARAMGVHLVSFGDGNRRAERRCRRCRAASCSTAYVHGSATFDVRRCVALNSAAPAVVDSYLADCHSNQNDSQGIAGWNGPGPFKIENNYVEGGHEVVFFGGQTPGVSGLIPSDIEIRRNHITRPMRWRGVWQVKNLFELKSAQRVLLEGNVLENNWPTRRSASRSSSRR
jgi:hypothetical protein